jgi:hypothetical protein
MNHGKIMVVLALLSGGAHAESSVWDKPAALPGPVRITVYRSPTCDCCGKWIRHLQKQNFSVNEIRSDEVAEKKRELGVPEALASCHTAVVDHYVIEGHVPAGDIVKLLKDRPAIAGIAVPGMPVGTPGMEMGARKDPFAVISFDAKGKTGKFSEYLKY